MSSTRKGRLVFGAVLTLGMAATPLAVEGQGYTGNYSFGTPATQADIDAWNKDVRPDGMGLPPGSGTFEKGQKIFADQCAVCHGQNLEGIRDPNLPQGGGPALIGGRGTLNTPKFKITVESYWPYATTLYDYILRAMPYTAPSSLKPDEVYSLVAFILGRADIIDKKAVMDAKSLPKVQMPNRDGFYPDNRPYPVKRYD
ncbi:MAG TPA: cytochrome c [Rhizomicrobium sp.]|nr:cytochrome c [Rhizomicrobium sp.]